MTYVLVAISTLAKRSRDLIHQRFDQIGKHGAAFRLDEGLNPHPRYDLKAMKAGNLNLRHRNAHRIKGVACTLILRCRWSNRLRNRLIETPPI